MQKNIVIINADHEAAQIVKDNLTDPSTNILCVSSIHEALLSFMNTDFCLVIIGCPHIRRGRSQAAICHAESPDNAHSHSVLAVLPCGAANQRVTIHYNCIGVFEVPDCRNISERDILLGTEIPLKIIPYNLIF